MRRRAFLKGGLAAGAILAGGSVAEHAAQGEGFVPAHNWNEKDGYNFGLGPTVGDRLNQGPFPQYAPDAVIPGDDVVMTTMPSDEVVPNYGKGLITYITADKGTEEIQGPDGQPADAQGAAALEKAIEELVAFPLGEKLYVRPTWREVQPQPGKLVLPEYLKQVFALAKSSGKRVAFRVQMCAPDYTHGPALPDFVLNTVPFVPSVLKDEADSREAQRYLDNPWSKAQPRYDVPVFQTAFRGLVEALAEEFDGHPDVEFMDTFLYGFWGEGHTWPFANNPFPDYATAERTWVTMLETQLSAFKKTPIVTNTQPDFSRVGNSEVLDRSVRAHEWMRSDTIFIENEQIEALSNRPAWAAAVLEQGIPARAPAERDADGAAPAENMMQHVMDVGVSYWSLWNFHAIGAWNLKRYAEAYPEAFARIARRVGYRVRPSFVWSYSDGARCGLIVGLANDGIAGVPGNLRLAVTREDGTVLAEGGLDAGYPLPGKIQQAQLVLPAGTAWQGLRLSAALQVKGMRVPVRWACREKCNEDGSLTLRGNLKRG
ncbi:MAG TPA: hypothetical protein VFE06_12005 [Acidobacteriaceae bacterium]|nr:hypothetical protein [Acidobacteriaceae bacterium]